MRACVRHAYLGHCNQTFFSRDDKKPEEETLMNITKILSNITEENINQVSLIELTRVKKEIQIWMEKDFDKVLDDLAKISGKFGKSFENRNVWVKWMVEEECFWAWSYNYCSIIFPIIEIKKAHGYFEFLLIFVFCIGNETNLSSLNICNCAGYPQWWSIWPGDKLYSNHSSSGS